MKRMICSILLFVLLFSFVSCDRSHLCSLDVVCSDENISVVVDGEAHDSFNFSSNDFNRQPLENYSQIDFYDTKSNSSNANIYKFEITSLVNDTYSLSLNLIDENKYVVDFLRIGISVDGKLRVYKYFDKREEIYHKENDPGSILHFNSKSEIFSELEIDISQGESKQITVFIWLEEAELYDKSGERYKGWADKSYDASPIRLSMEIK